MKDSEILKGKLLRNIDELEKSDWDGSKRKDGGVIFYRYISLSTLKNIIQNKSIRFSYPDVWDDPFEKRYLETDFSEFGYTRKRVYCLCLSQKFANEEASWMVYYVKNDPLVRISIRGGILLQALKNYKERCESKIFISKVQYCSKNDIRNVFKKGTSLFEKNFDGKQIIEDENYVQMMSLKRRSYEYENEYRIFVIPKGNNGKHEGYFDVDMDCGNLFKNLIRTITIGPISMNYPCECCDYQIGCHEIKKYETSKSDRVRVVKKDVRDMCTLNNLNDVDVFYSSLYEECSKIKKVTQGWKVECK